MIKKYLLKRKMNRLLKRLIYLFSMMSATPEKYINTDAFSLIGIDDHIYSLGINKNGDKYYITIRRTDKISIDAMICLSDGGTLFVDLYRNNDVVNSYTFSEQFWKEFPFILYKHISHE